MADEVKGFWSSIPGILTGIAAVITATTGLYIAINGNGAAIEEDKTTPPTPPPIASKDRLTEESGTASPLGLEEIKNIESAAKQEYEKLPQTTLKPLIGCELFPTVNTTASLMSWSNSYQKQIISDKNKSYACNKAIDYRGMAHCKEPNNLEIQQALHETLTLCSAAGIEWSDIEHSSIQK